MAKKTPIKPTLAKPPEAATKAPEFFLIPTALLVETLKLVGNLPASQAGATFEKLRRVVPHVPPPEPEPVAEALEVLAGNEAEAEAA